MSDQDETGKRIAIEARDDASLVTDAKLQKSAWNSREMAEDVELRDHRLSHAHNSASALMPRRSRDLTHLCSF